MPYMRNRNSGGYLRRHLNGDQLQIVHTIQYPCICLGSMWQSAATWHFPQHHSFPACFKLCTETWKQYIPMRNRAILLYLILNGLLFQLNVLIEVRGKSVLWFWSFSCESLCLARQNGGVIVGSHNWMAPEWLQGGSLKEPSDIYSFGMILPKVSAGMCLSSTSLINVMGF